MKKFLSAEPMLRPLGASLYVFVYVTDVGGVAVAAVSVCCLTSMLVGLFNEMLYFGGNLVARALVVGIDGRLGTRILRTRRRGYTCSDLMVLLLLELCMVLQV